MTFYLLLFILSRDGVAYTELAQYTDRAACFREARARDTNIICLPADVLARNLANGARLRASALLKP